MNSHSIDQNSCDITKLKSPSKKQKRRSITEYLDSVKEKLNTNGETILQIKCTPGAAKTEWHSLLDGETPIAKLRVAAAPERGKANSMITKFIQKEFTCGVEITTGHTNSTKLLKLWKK